MTWVATAVVGSALIGAYASNNAANKEVGAANNATAMQQGIYQQNEANLTPYMQQGNGAMARLSDLMGTSGNPLASGYGSLTHNFTAQDYLNNQDPGYRFQLQQGQQALQNSQASESGAMSGAALKGLIAYNQGMASTGYQNAYNRWFNNNNATYTRLSGLASLGENAAAGAGNMGVQSGANMANTITGAGNAAAAGAIGVGNAITGAVNNGTGYYMLNQMMNQNAPIAGFNNVGGGMYTDQQPWTVGPTPQ